MDPGIHPTYQPTYESYGEAQETHSVVNVAFIKSLGGILKLCEIILSCIVLICVAAGSKGWSSHSSGQWVNFVAAITLIIAALFFLFYLFNVIRRLRGPWVIIEFSSLVLATAFWFITFIVAAAMHGYGGSAIASAIFSFVAIAIYIAELCTRFRVSRQAQGFRITMTGVTTAPSAPNTYPHMAPSTGPPTHASPYPSGGAADESRVGFPGGYPPADRADDEFVMP